jgi:hypothetical protein
MGENAEWRKDGHLVRTWVSQETVAFKLIWLEIKFTKVVGY